MTAAADRTRGGRYSDARHAQNRRAPTVALLAGIVIGAAVADAADAPAAALASFRVVADAIPEPWAAAPGDAARGRALLIARDAANCVLCHAVPDAAIRFAGDLGPSLAGVGTRLSTPQLRLRVVDSQRLDSATIMPSYYRVDGLERVAVAYRGRPILTAVEVEDVVALLATLR